MTAKEKDASKEISFTKGDYLAAYSALNIAPKVIAEAKALKAD